MDIRFTAEEATFRDELRAWLTDVLPTLGDPPDSNDWTARRKWDTGWQRMLYDAGYAGINWPSEFGGRGSTPTEHLIFLEETTRMGAPYVGMNFVGQLHAGPTLILEATPEQQARHLPAMLKGEEVWCQGFSEPNAGSDLASLSHPGHARRRPLRGNRPEDLDIVRTRGRLLRAAGAHRPRRPQAPGHHLADLPHGPAGHRGPPLSPPLPDPASSARSFSTRSASRWRTGWGDENDGWRVAMVTFSFERGTAFISELLGHDESTGRDG